MTDPLDVADDLDTQVNAHDLPAGEPEAGFAPGHHADIRIAVRNGDFSEPPRDPTLPIDDLTNKLPGWSCVHAATVQAYWIADAGSGSGGIIRWVLTDPAALDEGYIEQLVGAVGTRDQQVFHMPATYVFNPTGAALGNVATTIAGQYVLDDTATTTGSSGERAFVFAAAPATLPLMLNPYTINGSVIPTDAAFLRVRLGVRCTTFPAAGISSIDVSRVAVYIAQSYYYITDSVAPATYPPARVDMRNGLLRLTPNGFNPNVFLLVQQVAAAASNFVAAFLADKDAYLGIQGVGHLRLPELTANPSTPPAGYMAAFPRDDNHLYLKDDAGVVRRLDYVIGTDVEAHDTDLTTFAGLAPTNDDVLQRKAGAWANRTIAQLLVDLAAPGTTFLKLSGGTLSGALILAADPATALGAATKQYVDSLAAGLDVKPSVVAATTANITLSGAQTIDGIAVVAGDRVLVKSQTAPAENGLYVCAAGAWSRASDADAWTELPGDMVFVERGTLYADTAWVCTVDAGGTLGTTAVTWSQFAGAGTYTAGTGLSLTGTQFAISDAELLALAGLTSAADALPYFTGSGTAALATLTSFIRSLLDDATQAAAMATLSAAGVVTGLPALATGSLTVSTDDNAGSVVVIGKHHDTGTGSAQTVKRKSRGTAAAPTIIGSGDAISADNTYAYDGATYLSVAQWLIVSDGAPSAGVIPTRHVWTTARASGAASEAMRLDSGGNLGIGKTAAAGVRLDVSGAAAVSGKLTATGGTAGGGTSFPVSPTTGDRYFRTDRNIEYVYDGTRWLSTTLYSDGLQTVGDIGHLTATATQGRAAVAFPGLYDLWLVSADLAFLVEAGGTALDASNKWVVDLYKQPAAALLASWTINSGTNSYRNGAAVAIGALLGTTNFVFQTFATKTGTPGALSAMTRINYRLVG